MGKVSAWWIWIFIWLVTLSDCAFAITFQDTYQDWELNPVVRLSGLLPLIATRLAATVAFSLLLWLHSNGYKIKSFQSRAVDWVITRLVPRAIALIGGVHLYLSIHYFVGALAAMTVR